MAIIVFIAIAVLLLSGGFRILIIAVTIHRSIASNWITRCAGELGAKLIIIFVPKPHVQLYSSRPPQGRGKMMQNQLG
jgi:hypothetical protein